MNKKATWTENDLKAAMLAVEKGKGKRESAGNFGELILLTYLGSRYIFIRKLGLSDKLFPFVEQYFRHSIFYT